MTPFFKSSKTTLIAILVAIEAIVSLLIALVDGDPETVPNWDQTISLIIVAFGFLFARDSDKKSEDVM